MGIGDKLHTLFFHNIYPALDDIFFVKLEVGDTISHQSSDPPVTLIDCDTVPRFVELVGSS